MSVKIQHSKIKAQKPFFCLVCSCIVLFSCNNNPKNTSSNNLPLKVKDSTRLTELPAPPNVKEEIPSQKELQQQIKNKEKDLLADESIDANKAKQIIRLYDTYHKYYYNSFDCPDYLFKAGEIAENIGQYNRAADFYQMCCNEYGDAFKFRAECIFRLANVYDLKLNDYIRAKETYQRVIREYPKTQLAKDAAAAIKLMGMSDEEMIKTFEAQNKNKK